MLRYFTHITPFFVLLLLCLGSHEDAAAQDTLGRYSPGFKFKNGLYYDFESFQDNCPSIPVEELLEANGDPIKSIEDAESLNYMLNDTLRPVDVDALYGFSDLGQVYLEHRGAFDRLVIVGTICHILHREERIDDRYAYNTGFDMIPVRREVEVEYIIDMRTGDKKPFDVGHIAEMISDDRRIYNRYLGLNRKQQRAQRYSILHEYNRAHPVYFKISSCP